MLSYSVGMTMTIVGHRLLQQSNTIQQIIVQVNIIKYNIVEIVQNSLYTSNLNIDIYKLQTDECSFKRSGVQQS